MRGSPTAKTLDEYLEGLSEDQRGALSTADCTCCLAQAPASLVRKLVKYRIAENAAQRRHAAAGAPRRR